MKMIQRNENGTTNFQAEQMNFNGMTYADIKQVALDVFNSNFLRLSTEANEIAKKRVDEITSQIISKLFNEYPEGIEQVNNPDFQYLLFNVQKEFARTGDNELGALLSSILIERTKKPKRTIVQIVLNEAIETASKLTIENIEALSLIFLVKYSEIYPFVNESEFYLFLDKYYKRFSKLNLKEETCFRHLEYAGCGKINPIAFSFIGYIMNFYSGIFAKGFDLQERKTKRLENTELNDFFVPCFNDNKKSQIYGINSDELRKKIMDRKICDDTKARLLNWYDQNTLSPLEIKNEIILKRDYMQEIFDTWENTSVRSFDLTSVGIAIAHRNLDIKIGGYKDISVWIK